MTTEYQIPRIPLLDVLRGVALVAMAIYHFGWDLSFFGYVTSAAVNDGPWKIFARCIASTFLVFVGIGLVLAHANGIRWTAFWNRWLKVAAAALVITIATYFFTPDAFIFFGILHQIAFASLFGLLFLRLPSIVLLVTGVLWIFAAPFLKIEILNGLYLAWTGLQTEIVRSNDYVPVFPWFGAVLIGMGISKYLLHSGTFSAIADKDKMSGTAPGKVLSFFGRNSLVFYLVHQPVLIALIYGYSLIVPAQNDELSMRDDFAESCQVGCEKTNTLEQCVFYCTCIEQRLDDANLFTAVVTGVLPFNEGKPDDIARRCNIEMFDLSEKVKP